MKRLFSLIATVAILGSVLGLTPTSVHATEITPTAGDLIKGSFSTVYYYSSDGNRYNFPNEKTYFTWYSDFSGVHTVSDATLASMRLVGNVTYRPGVRMVKLITVPKVYVVERGSILRWVTTESLASNLYGAAWNTKIDDLPDTFYPHYSIGSDITSTAQYDPTGQKNSTPTIDTDLGYTDPVGTIPTAPTLTDPGSSVSSGTNFTLSWTSSSDATRYTLQRDDDSSFSDPINIISGSGTTTPDYIVPVSTTTYYYRVNASNGVGTSSWSNVVDITVSTVGVPTAPVLTDPGSSTTAGASFTLSYSAVTGVTTYVLQQSTDPAFSTYSTIYSGLSTTYTHSISPSSTTTYYWRVQGRNAIGHGAWSNVVDLTVAGSSTPATVPDAPVLTGPGSPIASGASFTITYTSPSGATLYELQRDTNSSFSSPTVAYNGASTTYTSSLTVATSTTYHWRVRASNSYGNSAWSNVEDSTITVTPVSIPAAPTMTDPGTYVIDGTAYNLGWTESSGATYYCFEWDTQSDFPSATGWCSAGVMLSTLGQTSTTLLTEYFYHVKACNTAGCSDWSNTADMVVSNSDVVFASDYSGNVASALAAASSGETVYVESGTTYSGALTVPDGVSLVGEAAEHVTLNGGGAARAVTLGMSSTLQGFTIKNATSALVYCLNGYGSQIKNNILDASFSTSLTPNGVYISNSVGIIIANNTMYDPNAGVRSVSGIYSDANPTNNFLAFNNVIQGFKYGIYTSMAAAGISEYNLVYTPVPANSWVTIPAGTGDIPLAATFTSAYSNLRLAASSIGTDAGNPSSAYNDPDGTRNDMGVFGGPEAHQ
ncbi:MAG: hypothetical protein WCT24_00605 [Patescibacteria group bacterium]